MDLVQTFCSGIRDTYFDRALPYLEETARRQYDWNPFG